MNRARPTSPGIPGPTTVAVHGAVVNAAQVLVLVAYLVAVIFTFGLALFIFFIPLFVWLVIPWLGGNKLLPIAMQGRRWAAVPPSAAISLVSAWFSTAAALKTTGLDPDSPWGFLGDVAVILLTAAAIGAGCWSLIGLVVRRLFVN